MGVSPLAAPSVSELETLHLRRRKDLPEAIAAAFQIAEAQRPILEAAAPSGRVVQPRASKTTSSSPGSNG